MARNKGKINKKDRVSTSTWLKNASKSMGYGTIDVIKEIMPATMDIIDDNKDDVKEVISVLKEARKTSDGKKSGFNTYFNRLIGDKKDIVKTGISNAREDLRTGKFYNKERSSSFFNDFGDDFGEGFNIDLDEDFSLDDDLSDDSFDNDDSNHSVVVPNVVINSNITKNNPMVKAVESQTAAMIEMEKMNQDRSIKFSKANMLLTAEMGNKLFSGLTTINDNLSLMLKFQTETIGGYVGASLSNYEVQHNTYNSILEEIKKITTPKEKEINRYENPLDDVIGYGGFNIKGYFNLVKKQLNNAIDNDLFLSSIKMMLGDGDTLKSIVQEPLNFIVKGFVNKILPEITKKSMEKIDETISGFFPAILMKIAKLSDSDNPILAAIGNVLGIKNRPKKSIDLSSYERGPIPFDGVTKKAIVEVIPGYLSKILSTLSGKPEKAYDYNKGSFVDVETIYKDFEDKKRSAAESQFNALSDLILSSNDIQTGDYAQKNEYTKKLKEGFYKMASKGKFVNPRKYTDANGFDIDELEEFFDTMSEDERAITRSAIKNLSKGKQIKTFGIDILNANEAISKLYRQLENEENSVYNSLFNGLIDKDNLSYLKSVYEGNNPDKRQPFIQTDKFKLSSLDYLRDIKKILLEGVNVYIKGRSSDEDTRLNKMISRENDLLAQSYDNIPIGQTMLNPEMIKVLKNSGFNVNENLNELTEEEIQNYVQEYYKILKESKKGKKKPSFISKILKGKPKELYDNVSEKIDSALGAPGKAISKVLDAADNAMYEVVFADAETMKEKAKSIPKLFSSIGEKFLGFFSKLKTGFFDPIYDGLVGDEGIITEFKNSESWKKMKEKGSQFVDYLFGKKNEEGNREGGLFSDTANEFGDMWKGFKHYFTGNEYTDSKGKVIAKNDNSVFGNVKSMFGSFKKTMKEYFFGDEDPDKPAGERVRGVVTNIVDTLRGGFQNLSDALFGPKKFGDKENENHLNAAEFFKEFKAKMPKTLATGIIGGGAGLLLGGKLGILGSMFLPGGPVGGAIVGMATGYLSQSDKFKDWLFGPMDEETNTRVGGFISKSTQEFFKKNKTGIVAGAAIGGIKGLLGFGILPSFILGGPLTGAILGMSASMLYKSEAFQNFLFGKDIDENGKRTGGIISKITGKISSEDGKNKLGTIGAGIIGGAGLGLIGSQFGVLGALAFGPWTGAIAGAAVGIAATSEKWKKAIFGEFDEDEQVRKGGLITKFTNMISTEVVQPMKVFAKKWQFKIQDWFEEDVIEQLHDAMIPIKTELAYIKQSISDAFKRIGDFIKNSQTYKIVKKDLIEPIVEGFRDYVIAPFKKAGNMLIDAVGKVTGTIVSFPSTALKFIADKLEARQMRRGIKNVRKQAWENLKNSEPVRIFKEAIQPFTNAVDEIVDYTKKKINSVFKLFAKGLGFATKALFKAAGDVVMLPFKVISSPFKAVKTIKNAFYDGPGEIRDQDRLDSIYSGNRGFFGSLSDIAATFNPFSSLRKDSKIGTTIDPETGEERIIGAPQASERYKKRMERKAERDKRKSERANILKQLEEQLDSNRSTAKSLGYNNVDENGNLIESPYSLKEFNKIIDKQYSKKYGKDYKNLNSVDKDRFKIEKANSKNTESIKENTKETSSKLTDLIVLIKSALTGKKIKDSKFNEEYDKFLTNSTSEEENKSSFKDKIKRGSSVKTAKKNSISSPIDSNDFDYDSLYSGGPAVKSPKETISITKLGSTLGTTIAKTMDNLDDQEEAEKEKQDKQKSVSHNTAEHLKSEKEALAEKEKNLTWKEKLLGLVKRTSDDTSEHKKSWLKMFGPKGLIAVAVLTLLPLIVGLLNKIGLPSVIQNGINGITDFFGFTDQNGDRTDAAGNVIMNEDAVEVAGLGIAKGAAYGAKKMTKALKSEGGQYIAGAIKQGVSSIKQLPSKINEKLTSGKNTSAAAAAIDVSGGPVGQDTDKKAIDKFIEAVKSGIEKLKTHVVKLASDAKIKISGSKVANVLGKLKQVLSKSILVKYTGKITRAVIKLTGAVLSGEISDVVFGIWGGATGQTRSEAANLFGVNQADVTNGMRVTSGIIKAILSISWFFVIDLANDILISITGYDVIKQLAELIYGAIAGVDAKIELEEAQTSFQAEVDSYNELNMKLDPTATAITLDTYNDMTNKRATSKFLHGVKDFFVGKTSDPLDYVKNQQKKAEMAQMLVEDPTLVDNPAFQKIAAQLDEATEKVGGGKSGLFWNNKLTDALFGNKKQKEQYEEIKKQQEELIALAADPESGITVDSEEYKARMQTLNEAINLVTEGTGIVTYDSGILGRLWSFWVGTKGDKEKLIEAAKNKDELIKAAEEGKIDINSKEYAQRMDELNDELDHFTKKKGVGAGILSRIGKFFVGDKKDQEAMDGAIADYEQLMKDVQDEKLTTDSEEFKYRMAEINRVFNESSNETTGVFPAIYTFLVGKESDNVKLQDLLGKQQALITNITENMSDWSETELNTYGMMLSNINSEILGTGEKKGIFTYVSEFLFGKDEDTERMTSLIQAKDSFIKMIEEKGEELGITPGTTTYDNIIAQYDDAIKETKGKKSTLGKLVNYGKGWFAGKSKEEVDKELEIENMSIAELQEALKTGDLTENDQLYKERMYAITGDAKYKTPKSGLSGFKQRLQEVVNKAPDSEKAVAMAAIHNGLMAGASIESFRPIYGDVISFDDFDSEYAKYNPVNGTQLNKKIPIANKVGYMFGQTDEEGNLIEGSATDKFKNDMIETKEWFKGIGSWFGDLSKTSDAIGVVNNRILEYNRAGNLDGLKAVDASVPETLPASGIAKIVLGISKYANYPGTALTYYGNKIGDWFKETINNIPKVINAISTEDEKLRQFDMNGDMSGLNSYKPSVPEGTPMSGFGNTILFIDRLTHYPSTAIHWLGNRIGEGISYIVDGVPKVISAVRTENDKLRQYAENGDITGLNSYKPSVPEGTPMSGLGKAIIYISRLTHYPSAAIHWLGNSIGSGIGSIVDGVSAVIGNFTSGVDTIQGYASKGDLSSLRSYKPTVKAGTPMSGMIKGILNVTRYLNYPAAIMNHLFNTLRNAFDRLDGSVLDTIVSWVVDLANGGSGSASQLRGGPYDTSPQGADYSLGYRNYKKMHPEEKLTEKQFKAKFNIDGSSDINLNKLSASELKEYYKEYPQGGPYDTYTNWLGKFTSKYGMRNGKPHNGIDAVGKEGGSSKIVAFVPGTVVNSEYNTGGYGNRIVIKDNKGYYHTYAHLQTRYAKVGDVIKEGQVIGIQGNTGNSRGSHLHYGVGNAFNAGWVEPISYLKNNNNAFPGSSDTSSSYDTSTDVTSESTTSEATGITAISQAVSSALTDSLKPLSDISASVSGSLSELLGNPTSTSSSTSDTSVTDSSSISGNANSEKVWNYLIKKGLSPYAAAGILGNMEAESAFNPKNLQNSYEKKLGMTDDSYTASVDSGNYKRFSNDSAGYGLAQWTSSGRKANLLNFAKSRNKSIGDLGMQLDFLWNELNSGYNSSVLTPLKNAKSVAEASKIVLQKFEIPQGYNTSSTINYRKSLSDKYYAKYANAIGGPDLDIGIDPVMKDLFMGVDIDDNDIEVNTKNPFKNASNKEYGIGGPYETDDTKSIISATRAAINSLNNNEGSTSDKGVNLLQQAVNLLSLIVQGVDIIKDKEYPSGGTTVISTNNKSSNPVYQIAEDRRDELKNHKYEVAKKIAKAGLA